jgi:hypothetical protein
MSAPDQAPHEYRQPMYLPPPTPRPPSKRWKPWELALIIGGCVVLVGGLVVAYILSNGFSDGGGGGLGGPKPTIQLTSCQYDGVATHLQYRVTNNDKIRHDYYATGTANHSPMIPDTLVNVAPGETTNGELIGSSSSGGTCTLHVDQR